MQRATESHPTRQGSRTRFAVLAPARASPPARHLPPTRAARSARSRGVFFPADRRLRLGRWLANLVCIALATLTVFASAHFAEPALDAAAITRNAGPELMASAMRAPSFLVAPQALMAPTGAKPKR